jgi:EAL domain-containing protein (putative c-di-GMP-specific phosphodiesterase class I)
LENPASEEDFESVRRFVEALGKTGAKVGIDGFGSASLSLPFLESLPLSFVKLANNLLPSSGATGKGIAAVVAMAQALDWEVIATRVATAEDRRAIRDAGVKAMQGYAFAQPMTAIDFEQWLDGSQGVAFVV